MVSRREMRTLRVANIVLLGWALLLAIEVDGNGRVLGLSEKPSWVVAGTSLSVGAAMSTLLLIRDRRYRIMWSIFLALYVLMVAPKFIG
jgi:hypothetical protein